MVKIICEQYRDGVKDDAAPLVIPKLKNEKPEQTLERKFKGAEKRGWIVEWVSDIEFHAWKYYTDGDGTPERPNRKDRFFKVIT